MHAFLLQRAAAAAAAGAAGFKGEKKITRMYTHLYTPRGVNYANAIMRSNHDCAGKKNFFFF
jgi:hypothetical protein